MDPGGSMTNSGSIFSNILVLLLLVACNAFFAMCEIAVISLNDNKVKKMAKDGDKKAGIIARLIGQPSRFLATIQVGVTFSGFLASAIAADTFAAYIVQAFSKYAISPATVHAVSIVVITLLLSYISLVFGELVPKRIAMQNYEKISFGVARIIAFFSVVFRPFVVVLSASTNAILRLLGIDPDHTPEEVTEEEIRMMIDVGGESGTIEQSEKDMLNNIFEFDDRTAEEMMTHRTEIVAIELGTPLDEVVEIAIDSGYTRIPVFEEDLDSIVGVLYVKDLLGLAVKHPEKDFDIRDYMREPLYVLESTSCMSLLGQFQAQKIQLAIVVDEYGGTSGLVSMEDLLESIVGNIQDEYDDEEEEIFDCGDGVYIVDGLTALDDVLKFFSIAVDNADEYDTVGGYVMNELGYIPDEKSTPSISVDNVVFTVNAMDERRIAKLKVEIAPIESNEE